MAKKWSLREAVLEATGFDSKRVDSIIMAGEVLVDEVRVTKPGQRISVDSQVRVKQMSDYVSRGAYKLLKAIEVFTPVVSGRVCIDGGSSTGGFTQVLLQHGASRVYSVDCGTNQLDYSLRRDPRVVSMENCRVQDLNLTMLEPVATLGVTDVSFTSCIPIVEHFFGQLRLEQALILIKPQFEYSRLRQRLSLSPAFDGIVTSDVARNQILDATCEDIIKLGLKLDSRIVESPIKGTNGNVEYLVCITP